MVHKSPSARKLLGLRIKELRAQKSLTQEELADRCDLFRTYMSRIESGLANPTITVLQTLAQGLEVELYELLYKPDSEPVGRVRSVRPVSRGRVGR